MACLPGLAAGAVSLGLLAAAAPAGAQTPTSVKLVGNTGQTATANTVGADSDNAQPFTTGGNSTGYRLTAVKLSVVGASGTPTYTAHIYLADDTTSQPTGSSLGTLANPASLATDGIKTWTATGGGIDLDAGTDYVFVLDSSAFVTAAPDYQLTASDAEDSDAASGWSIADNYFSRTYLGGSWGERSDSLKIEIHGYSKLAAPSAPTVRAVSGLGDRLTVRWTAAPIAAAVTDYDVRWYKGAADPEDEADWVEAGEAGGHDHVNAGTKATLTGLEANTAYRVQVRAVNAGGAGPWSDSGGATTFTASDGSTTTGGALVSNTGQTATSNPVDADVDNAQPFTTGSNAGGYKLTAVKATISGGTGTPTYTAHIFLADTTTGRPTGSSLGTLTNPASLTTDGTKTWTAPEGGIDLAAETVYAFVLDSSALVLSAVPRYQLTASDAEDSDAASGWSIGNKSFLRSFSTSTWHERSESLQIELHGHARRAPEAPTVRAVSGLGDRLTVRWREPSVEGGGAITDYDVRYYKGAADPEDEADWIESGEAGGHDHVGTATKATLTGLDEATTYRVQVRAVTASGNGPWSSSGVAATPVWLGGSTTSGSLVSTTGQTRTGTKAFTVDYAQAFTTGGSSGGYRMTGLDIQLQQAVGPPTYTVAIHEDSAGVPGTLAGTLTNPSSLPTTWGNARYTTTGIDLDAGTTYWVVIDLHSSNSQTKLASTSSNGEDAGAQAGWSVADDILARTTDATSWSTTPASTDSLMLSIHGRAKGDNPFRASAGGGLVGNTGQTSLPGGGVLLERSLAQAFDTGGHASGYKLTAVTAHVAGGTGTPTFTAHVYLADDTTGHPTGGSLGTLVNPASLATSGSYTWNARGGGIDLDAGESYLFVLDVSAAAGSGHPGITTTNSGFEDAGAASGWSIADSGITKAVAGWGNVVPARALKIAIHGYAKRGLAAPSVSAVPLQPDRLSVRWPPPPGVPATDYDLRYYRGSLDPGDEADWIEAGEPGGHDHAGVLRTATVTGLLPSTTYRVQVRAVIDGSAGPWSASGSGRTEGESGASGSAAVEVLTGNFRETATAVYPLAPHDRAQGFTTDGPPLGHALGYTVTSVDLQFASAPDASVRVRLATGASTTGAGTTLATLRNPATFRGGANRFTAPRGTTLDPDTEYFVVVEGAAGELTWTRFNSHRREGRVHWRISDTSLYRDAATTGAWTSSSEKMTFRVNGRANVGDPPGRPDAPTAVPQPGTTGVVVTWFAPDDTGSGITDYDLRHFQGTADPADAADW
ncbi:MAG: fibronectin type III domain-containing protein, partial [bacterium]|nr:fibronectin type III domain-containing protein [bacterium]